MLGGTDEIVTAIEEFYASAKNDNGELTYSKGAYERLQEAANKGFCGIKYFAINNTAIGAGVATGAVDFTAANAQLGGDSAEAGAINAAIGLLQNLLSCFILNGYSNAQRMRMSENAKIENKNYICPVTWCCPLHNVCFNSSSAFAEASAILKDPDAMIAKWNDEGERRTKIQEDTRVVVRAPSAVSDKQPLMRM